MLFSTLQAVASQCNQFGKRFTFVTKSLLPQLSFLWKSLTRNPKNGFLKKLPKNSFQSHTYHFELVDFYKKAWMVSKLYHSAKLPKLQFCNVHCHTADKADILVYNKSFDLMIATYIIAFVSMVHIALVYKTLLSHEIVQ